MLWSTAVALDGVDLDVQRNRRRLEWVPGGMSDESVIKIEIRGHEKAALEAARRISDMFLSSGPCRLRRTPGKQEVEVLVYADVHRGADEGGYDDEGAAHASTLDWDPGCSHVSEAAFAYDERPTRSG
ncbi:hypothetical protein M8Z33_41890 [Streptomyces sp. ZAF1911]|uniref:hypothetical protein n=1 Tax=Streptomyces sp. ZAF1911 TaxID=2944129 RepID=UPI00237B177A|nr:hypothetical protein [Streptomyces sp. ZAF1911]MDD9383090.1 hypothetical protein [Streptomyces sp. ZAF1911]